jgi:hypothetical protein
MPTGGELRSDGSMHVQETTMPRTSARNHLALFTLTLVATAAAAAQPRTQIGLAVPLGRNSSWQAAQAAGASIYKLYVVTADHPDRRHSCRVRSFTTDMLVCSRVIGEPRTYRLDQVDAIIIPGDGHLKLRIWVGLNADWARQSGAPLCLRLHALHAQRQPRS